MVYMIPYYKVSVYHRILVNITPEFWCKSSALISNFTAEELNTL